MKTDFINECHVEGYIFDHSLQKRTDKNDVDYINGRINVATDEDATNIVTVNYTYVTEVYSKSGKPNQNFAILEQIMDSENTYQLKGTEAQKVRIDGDIRVNDFVASDGTMVAQKQVSASFTHFMNAGEPINPEKAATFTADMLVSSCIEKEMNDKSYVTLGGYVFGYQGRIVPVEFSVNGQDGMNYFLGKDISSSNPWCGKVWGNMISTVVTHEETVESDFGAPQVSTTSRTFKAWDVIGGTEYSEGWDDESFITKDELKKALADREEVLANVRKRNDEYRASRSGKAGFPTNNTTAKTETKAAPADNDDDFLF